MVIAVIAKQDTIRVYRLLANGANRSPQVVHPPQGLNVAPNPKPTYQQPICQQIQPIVGTMRDADQIGTIMAGAWLIDHDKAPTASEAKTWLERGLDIP